MRMLAPLFLLLALCCPPTLQCAAKTPQKSLKGEQLGLSFLPRSQCFLEGAFLFADLKWTFVDLNSLLVARFPELIFLANKSCTWGLGTAFALFFVQL